MKLFDVQMPMRGVKMTVLIPGRSGRISVWQRTEYFKSDSFFSKLFLRWGMHAFRFSKCKWRGFLAFGSFFSNRIHHRIRDLFSSVLRHCLDCRFSLQHAQPSNFFLQLTDRLVEIRCWNCLSVI